MKLPFSIVRAVRNLLILIVGFIALVFVINLPVFDEELLPEVAELLEPTELPPTGQNAFVALVGLPAASDRDMVAVGEQALAQYKTLTPFDQLTGNLGEENTKRIFGGSGFDDQWISRLGNCSQGEENCLLFYSNKAQKILADTPRAERMVKRFQALAAMLDYAVPVPSNIYPNYYQVLLKSNDLLVGKAYSEGGSGSAITALEQSIGFWRRQLDKPDTLISRMVAIAAIHKNLELLSNLIELEKISGDDYTRIAGLLAPLTPNELDMTDVLFYELSYISQLIFDPTAMQIEESSLWDKIQFFGFYKLMMQPNATLNLSYQEFITPAGCLSRQPWQDYKRYSQSGNNEACGIENSGKQQRRWYLNLYNPAGIQTHSLASLDTYVPYIARGYDLNGMLALLRLQLQLHTGAVASIDELLQENAVQDNYLPNPVQYNPDTKKLFFDCLQQLRNRECAVTLFARE